MAPHEWVRAADAGVVYKTDSGGHDSDHTVIGRQPILWDVAGAVIEWSMDKRQVEKLNRALVDQGIGIDDRALRFYRAAYAAFRTGFVSLGLGQTGDNGDGERRRLRDAFERYKHCLAEEIGADCREGCYSAHEDHGAQSVS